jgi:hypothetical protein
VFEFNRPATPPTSNADPGGTSLMRNSLSAMVSGSFRRSCDRCGLSEPSVETRFAKSGVFAGE